MALFERGRREGLDRTEQAAFSKVADALIFDTPQGFRLTRQNIPELSRKLQEEFLAQDVEHERSKIAHFSQVLDDMLKSLPKIEGQEGPPAAELQEMEVTIPWEISDEEKEKFTPTEAFLRATQTYTALRNIDASNSYGAWGFTPKIASLQTKDSSLEYGRDGKNCFGVVQALGAICRRLNIPFEMGITADHPFLIAQVEGKTYFASLYGVQEARGTFEVKDGYKTYAPAKEDDIPYAMMVVWNYDEALVYELLENLEVLRQISLGNEIENLPGTLVRGKEIAAANKETLQAGSWRIMQDKLVPGLSRYFETHAQQWAKEIDSVASHRALDNFFKELMDMAKSETSFKDRSIEEFKKDFLPMAKAHSPQILAYFKDGTAFSSDTPADIIHFCEVSRAATAAIPVPEFRAMVIDRFLRPFVAQEESLTKE